MLVLRVFSSSSSSCHEFFDLDIRLCDLRQPDYRSFSLFSSHDRVSFLFSFTSDSLTFLSNNETRGFSVILIFVQKDVSVSFCPFLSVHCFVPRIALKNASISGSRRRIKEKLPENQSLVFLEFGLEGKCHASSSSLTVTCGSSFKHW